MTLDVAAASISQTERFIPLRADDLARLLASSEFVAAGEQASFLDLCQMLKSVFHFEYHQQLLQLKDAYAAFDPDSDTVRMQWPDDDPENETVDCLFTSLTEMFERANFRQLSRAQTEDAFQDCSAYGLNLIVDFDVFDRLEIFSRGESQVGQDFRSWKNWFRTETRQIAVHQRLVIAFRLKADSAASQATSAGDGAVSLKIFKEIPKGDLEMLLPGTRVRMTLLDRAKIALPTVSGLVMTVYKLVKAGMAIAFAGAYGVMAFLSLIGGTIGYGVKSFFGYLRTKDKYQANLTRNLYFQNLDNNAGVLFRLIDEVEEQEFREAILAYALLGRENAPFGLTLVELDQQAESLLLSAIGSPVDFDAVDALDKLKRLGLVEVTESRFRSTPLVTALRTLDRRWDQAFNWNTAKDQPRRAA